MALAQQPGYKPALLPLKHISKSNQGILSPLAIEICDNGIDDEGNGLADLKDYKCYYDQLANDKCEVSKIIWGCTGDRLYWSDAETGETRYVGNMNGVYMNDICWAANGKLYGVDGANIWEIVPNTAAISPVLSLIMFAGINGLVGDMNGNIYFSTLGGIGMDTQIGKVNLATGEVTILAYMTDVRTAGDLTFLNGRLYLSCTGYKMAIINTASGEFTVHPLINSPVEGSMGMITLGDGYLYITYLDKIYQVDPLTMQVIPTPFFDFNIPFIGFSGLSNYSEVCNSPNCKATLDISVVSASPFCSATGAMLKGDGQGIRGEAVYEWTMPDRSIVKDANLTAMSTGMYRLNYYGVTDFCGDKDSVYIEILPSPAVQFGNDTLICKNSSAELIPDLGTSITSYTWQDGSTDIKYTAVTAGTYWLQVANSCGAARDTIVVTEANFPEVQLAENTAICPGSSLTLENKKQQQIWDIYTWSDGSFNETITIQSAGIYWLQNVNVCGAVRDSIVVSYKDSCTCFPLYPQVALGNDVTICNYETVTLKNALDQNGFRYNWQDASTGRNIIAKSPGLYWVDVSTYCGTVRDSVIVFEKTTGCERKVMVPSAFTPNGDGRNDLFRPSVYLKNMNLLFITDGGRLYSAANNLVKDGMEW